LELDTPANESGQLHAKVKTQAQSVQLGPGCRPRKRPKQRFLLLGSKTFAGVHHVDRRPRSRLARPISNSSQWSALRKFDRIVPQSEHDLVQYPRSFLTRKD
jgi:hypothetical protein